MSKLKRKLKKNKGRRSDQVLKKKLVEKTASSSLNPFEVKVNRTKHDILGRSKKHDRGLPGISRQKTFTKRKNTLLQEYRLQGKSNVFADKRIGEKEFLSNEEKASARFIMQRSRQQKNSVYNLNDEDEEITHLGIPVSEIEKHNEIPSDSDSDDNLGADFVSKAHFGGFLTKKEESKVSHKDIGDLIAQSKQRKHEKQVLKDATLEMTETLDEKWKELRKLLPGKNYDVKASTSSSSGAKENEDYDTILKTLKFTTTKPIQCNIEKQDLDEQLVPTSYEEFRQMISGSIEDEPLVIIEKLITSNSQPENKKKLEHIFSILLQYFEELCHAEVIKFEILDKLGMHLHTIAAMFPVSSSEVFLNVVTSKHQELQEKLDQKRKRTFAFPSIDYLLLLKLSVTLFSTPHTYHSVLTPCILFMSEILMECKASDRRSIATSLFICNSLLQCASLNKQLIPEALVYLLDLINASTVPGTQPLNNTALPDLRFNTLNYEIKDWALPLSYIVEDTADLSGVAKARIVKHALDICIQFSALYKDMEAHEELFEPFVKALSVLSARDHPAEIKNSAEKLLQQIRWKALKVPLAAQKRKPKLLKLYEPKIDTYSEKRKGRQDNKLLPKYKRELKGAVREIRRDTSFLAQHMLQERIQQDQERKRKVNKLYQELAEQEGSFRALGKKKKK